uniref:FG-GAP-like repeat-containing protein n=1 Tax=Azospirillum argentinense TaxID=2970906 RepID=UPI0027E33781|nr:FG-GAP-like repeat-containing protein [Azospirillum argentinense]
MADPNFTLLGTALFGIGKVGPNGVAGQATPVFVDIDGDGDLDALIGDVNGGLTLYRNVGTSGWPSFTHAGTNPFGLSNVGGWSSPAFADLDGDGDLDVVIGNSGSMVVYLQAPPPPTAAGASTSPRRHRPPARSASTPTAPTPSRPPPPPPTPPATTCCTAGPATTCCSPTAGRTRCGAARARTSSPSGATPAGRW